MYLLRSLLCCASADSNEEEISVLAAMQSDYVKTIIKFNNKERMNFGPDDDLNDQMEFCKNPFGVKTSQTDFSIH